MDIAEKIPMVTIGSKEVRNLIKGSNKLVINAVINSPKITEDEMLGYSKNRSVSKEALKLIASKKEWMKNYQIKLSLVIKCKTSGASRFLNQILEKDLGNIAKDKNIPSVISRTASKILSQKGKV